MPCAFSSLHVAATWGGGCGGRGRGAGEGRHRDMQAASSKFRLVSAGAGARATPACHHDAHDARCMHATRRESGQHAAAPGPARRGGAGTAACTHRLLCRCGPHAVRVYLGDTAAARADGSQGRAVCRSPWLSGQRGVSQKKKKKAAASAQHTHTHTRQHYCFKYLQDGKATVSISTCC